MARKLMVVIERHNTVFNTLDLHAKRTIRRAEHYIIANRELFYVRQFVSWDTLFQRLIINSIGFSCGNGDGCAIAYAHYAKPFFECRQNLALANAELIGNATL